MACRADDSWEDWEEAADVPELPKLPAAGAAAPAVDDKFAGEDEGEDAVSLNPSRCVRCLETTHHRTFYLWHVSGTDGGSRHGRCCSS